MFRWKKLTAVAVVAGLALTGCAAQGGDSPAESTTLTLGAILAPTSFSAQDANWANQAPFLQAAYDTLLRAEPDGTVVGMLATEWSYDETNTKLTLKLRDDVTFSDGTKFTADAAMQNLDRFKTGASPDASRLAAYDSSVAVDDTTLEITLTAPDPAFVNYLTTDAGLVQSPDSFGNDDIATNPVGSGPYILDTAKSVTGTSYVYTSNPDYWAPELKHYDNLVINVYGDPTAAVNAVKAGEVNGMKLANNDALAEVEGAGFDLTPFELDWTGFILFDRGGTMAPELGNVKVRQAMSWAFDREALLTALAGGRGTLTNQIFPVTSEAYDAELDSTYGYDVEKAKDLLTEAGYPNGFTISLPNTSLAPPAWWALMEQQLADVGITVNYTDTGTNFISDILAPKFGATWMQLEQQQDWQLINFAVAPTATFNPFKYSDPIVDGYIADIAAAAPEDQGAIAAELNKYIVEQAWFIPWYRIESNFATDANTDVVAQAGNAYPYLWSFTPSK
jgi:peptide/nickel transport system substrate-binding protein